jgi:drug/metabolite transporter (DMT)-like permease
MLAIALALASSVCWGTSDFIGGVQARRIPLLEVMIISQGVGLIGLFAFVAVTGHGAPSLTDLLPAAGAGLGGIFALMAFYRALAIGTMSIVAPISATGVAVPVIVGIAGGDRPAIVQAAGIAAATIGVVLAAREGGGDGDARVSRASIALALVAAVGFGSFFVGMRASARHDIAWALIASRGAGVAALIVPAVVAKTIRRLDRAALRPLLAMGALDLGANAFYAVATRHGLLSEVAVASSLYPLATVLLARGLLGERVRRIQEVGIAAALAGVVLMAAG